MCTRTQFTWLFCVCVGCSSTARASCHVQKRLNNFDLEHPVFLPQVQHPHKFTLQKENKIAKKQIKERPAKFIRPKLVQYMTTIDGIPANIKYCEIFTNSFCSYPVFHGAKAEVLKSSCDVFGEPRAKHVLVCSKLVSGLPDNGIHHVQACYLVLRLTLKRAVKNRFELIHVC